MELSTIELINGLMSILFVSISIILGATIVSRYFKHKQRTLLLVGLTWIGLISTWYSSSLAVLLILTTGEGISDELYMFLGNGLIPITAILWMIALTDLLVSNKEKQKLILLIIGIYSALFEIYYLYFLFTNPSMLGEVLSPVDASYGMIVTIYQLSMVILMIITGTLFGRKSLRSDNPEIRLKGTLLIIAFWSFFIGAIFEIVSHISIIILIVGRLILISSAIEFYSGFLLPNWMKKLFLTKKE
ncbi:MAG: hypothetical protein ACTSPS_01725 [Promethearchaeota archaeon]